MTVEAAGFIDDIDPTLPLGTDNFSEGDDHLRNFKKSVQDSFPNIAGAMTVTQADLNGFFANTNVMLFQLTTAPTGWTKETTHNNKALRIVTGTISTGGTSAFTTTFGSGKTTDSHTLIVAEMPAHTHTSNALFQSNGYSANNGFSHATNSAVATSSTGGDGGHTHPLTNFDLQYVDLILAKKD